MEKRNNACDREYMMRTQILFNWILVWSALNSLKTGHILLTIDNNIQNIKPGNASKPETEIDKKTYWLKPTGITCQCYSCYIHIDVWSREKLLCISTFFRLSGYPIIPGEMSPKPSDYWRKSLWWKSATLRAATALGTKLH